MRSTHSHPWRRRSRPELPSSRDLNSCATPPEPLGGSRYKVQFTAGPETHAKLVAAQALLRHQIPDGDLARIFDRALDAVLHEMRRAKFAKTDSPREARTSEGSASRHIPAAIRRAVAARDGEQLHLRGAGRPAL